jgi:hypothetical protein
MRWRLRAERFVLRAKERSRSRCRAKGRSMPEQLDAERQRLYRDAAALIGLLDRRGMPPPCHPAHAQEGSIRAGWTPDSGEHGKTQRLITFCGVPELSI